MGFFKKRGKPRQYKIERTGNFFELEVWDRRWGTWDDVNLIVSHRLGAVETLRAYAAFDAEIRGYGDNYKITELI